MHHSVPTTNKSEQQFRLLDLPAELRIQIYDLLLVSRFKSQKHSTLAVGQKNVLLDMNPDPEYRTMEPSILQTCKQIYREAVPILYSQNVFYIEIPGPMVKLMEQIGSMNVKFIRSLEIRVSCFAELWQWLRLLHILSEKTTGLRSIKLVWDAIRDYPSNSIHIGGEKRGLGDNVLFVRALARIQGLEKLEIGGYYAKHWPQYLEDNMNVQVRAGIGYPRPLNRARPENEETVRKLDEIKLGKVHGVSEWDGGFDSIE